MAQLAAGNENSILKIREFLGLNENPDGDTHLRPGELSQCRNFQITRDKHLRLRPGQRTTLDLRAAWDALSSRPSGVSSPEFSGCWTGTLDGERHTVASFGGVLWDIDPAGGAPVRKGTCTQAPASFFGFGNKVYLLNGHEYLSWDGGAGSSFQTVEGYIPTVRTASTPQGGGTLLENVNRLTGKRKVKFSPDGKAASFLLEKDIDEVVSVTGTSLSYTVDKAAGTVTFSAAPPAGVNTVVITYRKGNGAREEVERMRFAEFYNGATDTRVFLYGDGTNKTIYSGMDLDKSAPTAEYFPDLFEASVGDGFQDGFRLEHGLLHRDDRPGAGEHRVPGAAGQPAAGERGSWPGPASGEQPPLPGGAEYLPVEGRDHRRKHHGGHPERQPNLRPGALHAFRL